MMRKVGTGPPLNQRLVTRVFEHVVIYANRRR